MRLLAGPNDLDYVSDLFQVVFVGFIVLLALPVVLLIAALMRPWLLRMRTEHRRRQLAEVAQRLGLSPEYGIEARIAAMPFALFRRSGETRVSSVFAGRVGDMRVWAFDFHWVEVHRTRHGIPVWRSYHRYTCALTDLDAVCPPLTITKERWFQRLGKPLERWLGHPTPDVDFELETFNRKFEVRTRDRRFAFALMDARMMEWLLSTHGAFSFEVNGRALLAYVPEAKPAKLWDLVGALRTFRARVPRVVASLHPDEQQPAAPSDGSLPRTAPDDQQWLQPGQMRLEVRTGTIPVGPASAGAPPVMPAPGAPDAGGAAVPMTPQPVRPSSPYGTPPPW